MAYVQLIGKFIVLPLLESFYQPTVRSGNHNNNNNNNASNVDADNNNDQLIDEPSWKQCKKYIDNKLVTKTNPTCVSLILFVICCMSISLIFLTNVNVINDEDLWQGKNNYNYNDFFQEQTLYPTDLPTDSPTFSPSFSPTMSPTARPTGFPTNKPTSNANAYTTTTLNFFVSIIIGRALWMLST